jgi:hypothetical protein
MTESTPCRSTSQHTPGPWTIRGGENGLDYFPNPQIDGPNGLSVAHATQRTCITRDAHLSITEEQAMANAHLIAAAPELLAALQVVVSDWTEQFERNGHLAPSWCKQARAAIARATTGETQ